MKKKDKISSLLVKLEKILKNLKLWSNQPIDPVKLQSTEPFSIDTMDFHEWLQFVFIEKIRGMIILNIELPRNTAIAPMAEFVYKDDKEKIELIDLLREIDCLLSM